MHQGESLLIYLDGKFSRRYQVSELRSLLKLITHQQSHRHFCRYLYWSEVGNRPQVKVMSLTEDGSSMMPTMIITNITSPNSLYLDQDLYILDGATGVVYRCNVESIDGKGNYQVRHLLNTQKCNVHRSQVKAVLWRLTFLVAKLLRHFSTVQSQCASIGRQFLEKVHSLAYPSGIRRLSCIVTGVSTRWPRTI